MDCVNQNPCNYWYNYLYLCMPYNNICGLLLWRNILIAAERRNLACSLLNVRARWLLACHRQHPYDLRHKDLDWFRDKLVLDDMDIIPLCDDRFGLLLCFDLLPHLSWHLIPSAETYFSNTCISLALVSGLMITSSAPFEMNNSMSVGKALPVTPARQREQMYTAVR